jgi:transcriptional regulator with XRE-family HTH domain
VTIGERIRALRERNKMSAAALARAAGVSRSAIAQIESGVAKSPSFETGLLIARALGVSPYELVFGEKRKPEAVDLDVVPDLAEQLRRVREQLEKIEKQVARRRRRR